MWARLRYGGINISRDRADVFNGLRHKQCHTRTWQDRAGGWRWWLGGILDQTPKSKIELRKEMESFTAPKKKKLSMSMFFLYHMTLTHNNNKKNLFICQPVSSPHFNSWTTFVIFLQCFSKVCEHLRISCISAQAWSRVWLELSWLKEFSPEFPVYSDAALQSSIGIIKNTCGGWCSFMMKVSLCWVSYLKTIMASIPHH